METHYGSSQNITRNGVAFRCMHVSLFCSIILAFSIYRLLAARNLTQFLSAVSARRSGSMAAPPPPSARATYEHGQNTCCEHVGIMNNG